MKEEKNAAIKLNVNDAVEIAHATLLNRPSISYFSGICTDITYIKRGDLFISRVCDNQEEQIQQALKIGAFGILFDSDIAMGDNEVAWISTESLDEAVSRLVRYFLIHKNIISFLLQQEEFELASAMLSNKGTILCYQGDIDGLLSCIITHNITHLFFLPNICTDNQFFIEAHTTQPCQNLPFEILSYSLFELKIIYHSKNYDIPIPKFFTNVLGSVIELCERFSLNIELEHITYLSSFHPLYLDMRGALTDIGNSNRVALSCTNLDIFEKCLAYFALNAKWAKTTLFVPENYGEFFQPFGESYVYQSIEHLGFLLQDLHFNFALIFGLESKKLEVFLKNKIIQVHSLFE